MLVSKIISSAFRKIGAVASGEAMDTSENADALETLQVMLRSWSADSLVVFSDIHETFSLVSGTATYTWGEGATINTLRPNTVTGASITDASNVTHRVEIITVEEYRELTDKTKSERPYYLHPQYNYPYVSIYLYPTPNAIETLNLESLKPFTELSSFAAATDEIDMPLYYQEPIIYNLAVRLASEFGKVIPPEVSALASASYNRLVNRNAVNHPKYTEQIDLGIPVRYRDAAAYNINTNTTAVPGE